MGRMRATNCTVVGSFFSGYRVKVHWIQQDKRKYYSMVNTLNKSTSIIVRIRITFDSISLELRKAHSFDIPICGCYKWTKTYKVTIFHKPQLINKWMWYHQNRHTGYSDWLRTHISLPDIVDSLGQWNGRTFFLMRLNLSSASVGMARARYN